MRANHAVSEMISSGYASFAETAASFGAINCLPHNDMRHIGQCQGRPIALGGPSLPDPFIGHTIGKLQLIGKSLKGVTLET